ncbi:hypothetical protein RND81_14G253600 [Saponaria officinalis]|uniref:Uncharacterized protein n=1 Tax=Saponaria officinalis TaxID=3572 RepID=A0AAW1GUI8_SAPOF
MKFPSLFFFFFFLLLLVCKQERGVAAGRRGAVEYWKKVMRDEAMPEVINGLLMDEDITDPLSSEQNKNDKFWNHFNREFDATSNVIIYLPHGKNHKHEELQLPDDPS